MAEELTNIHDEQFAKKRWAEIRKLDFQLDVIKTLTICLIAILVGRIA